MLETADVLEGTWEELRLHDEELAGHTVRIIIMDKAPSREADRADESDAESGPTLGQLLAGRIGKFDFGAANLGERAEEEYGKYLEEQYLAQRKPQQ